MKDSYVKSLRSNIACASNSYFFKGRNRVFFTWILSSAKPIFTERFSLAYTSG